MAQALLYKSRVDYRTLLAQIERRRDWPNRETSFEAFRRALARLSLPHLHERVFVIAGTNGKGTVAKTLEVLLEAAGERVGLYTSPHLIDTTERIRSHGLDLTREEFVQAFALIAFAAEGLSHFEILTLMMAEVFFGGRVREPVSYAVLEVGVGGRWDPTRAFAHFTSVITSLALDHTALLGGDLASISRAKFGIVDHETCVVHGELPPEALATATEVRAAKGGRWIEVPRASFFVERGADPRWILRSPWGQAPLALKGARAADNTLLALSAFAAAGFEVRATLPALAHVAWPGRMEEFRVNGRRVFLSGDHNPAGVASLAEILREYTYRRVWLVVGIGSAKAQGEMLAEFMRLPRGELVLTSTPFRSAECRNYGEWLARAVFVNADPLVALQWAVAQSNAVDLVLVSGSLYLVGAIRDSLLERL